MTTETLICTSHGLWRHLSEQSSHCVFSTGMETNVTKQIKQMHLEICFLNHVFESSLILDITICSNRVL